MGNRVSAKISLGPRPTPKPKKRIEFVIRIDRVVRDLCLPTSTEILVSWLAEEINHLRKQCALEFLKRAYLAHLQISPPAEIVLHLLSGIRSLQMFIEPLSQDSSSFFWQIPTSLPSMNGGTGRSRWKSIRIESVLFRRVHNTVVSSVSHYVSWWSRSDKRMPKYTASSRGEG